jgi:hypothetical protein
MSQPRHDERVPRPLASTGLLVIRWWFGFTYVVAGIGGLVAAPIMLVPGDWGGIYMLIGSPVIIALGWLIHPWGLQRRLRA